MVVTVFFLTLGERALVMGCVGVLLLALREVAVPALFGVPVFVGLPFGERPFLVVVTCFLFTFGEIAVLLVLHAGSRLVFGGPTDRVCGDPSVPASRQSTQSNVLVTAFFHCAYSFATVALSIEGFHSASLPQLERRSSTFFQNPTASPAA